MTQTDMTPLQRLAKVLQLGTPSNYRNHTYINGESLYFPTGRVYGGQVIAQSLMAASRTVAPSRLPNSIHGYFISAGDIRQDLLFDVENLRDGRSFSARRVNVTQAQAYRKQIGQIIPGPVQAAMAAGLRDFDAVKTQHARYQERLGMLVSALRAYGYCTDMPQGALYVWVKAKSGDCWEDLRQLAEIGIVASPGEFYGAPEYLRFSATASDAAIASAAERLAR